MFAALGASRGAGGRSRVAAALARHDADPKLSAALTLAHARAWKTVEILLAGESFTGHRALAPTRTWSEVAAETWAVYELARRNAA